MKIRHRHYPAVVVGSGCAGLSAAATLAAQGMNLLLVDENPGLGGQLLRGRWPVKDLASRIDRSKGKGFSLVKDLNEMDASRVEILSRARLVGIFGGNTLLILDVSVQPKEQKITEITADRIILACGARERYLPFKGWTLPGVISCGAAQILIKTHGVLPAPVTFLAGTSPLQMVLASQILLNGGRVGGLFNFASFYKGLEIFAHLPQALPRAVEGAIHQARILAHHVPVRYRTGIVRANGKNNLESLVLARVDREGRFIPRTETKLSVRALAMGYGFAPNVELPAQAGCRLEYAQKKGGWIVYVTPDLVTSVPNILAAGEITGIGGGKKSLVEGRMAALTLLGRIDPALAAQRKQEQAYGRFLNRFCEIPLAAWNQIHKDTMICRCEEITMGEIRRAVAQGGETSVMLKRITRAGMGHCQGRTCTPMILEILGALTHKSPAHIGAPSARTPVKTIPIGSLIE